MNKTFRLILSVIFGILLLVSIWYFSNLFTYFVIAFILSMIGHPIMRTLSKVKIRKQPLPSALRAGLTLLVIILVILGLFMLLVPMVRQQSNTINQIDYTEISNTLGATLANVDEELLRYGVLQPEQHLEQVLEEKLTDLVNMIKFRNVVQSLVSFTGSSFMAAFSILFMAFFFLKDEKLVLNLILLLTPDAYTDKVRNVMRQTKHLLSRYFVGVLIEISCMITLIIIGLSLLGVPGATLIGTIGGTMNIIPYLGPIIGASIGSLLAVFEEIARGNYNDFYFEGLKVLLVFGIANLIDNIVLQPLIYSKSVKAHPLEIFIVIIMAGSLMGILGMIVAIPFYTMIRIILGEFFSEFKVVRALTQKMVED